MRAWSRHSGSDEVQVTSHSNIRQRTNGVLYFNIRTYCWPMRLWRAFIVDSGGYPRSIKAGDPWWQETIVSKGCPRLDDDLNQLEDNYAPRLEWPGALDFLGQCAAETLKKAILQPHVGIGHL
jgi:hypothetical protein